MRRECRRTWGAWTAAAFAGALFLALPSGALAAAGDFTEFPIPTAGTQSPDIITGGDGNLWFTEHTPGIARMTPSGITREFIYSTSTPTNLAVAQDGNVWFSDPQFHRVGRIKPLGAIKFFATPTNDAFPSGLEAGPGALWITEGFTPPNLGRLGPGGLGGNPPAIVNVSSPTKIGDIAAGIDGNMWFTEKSAPSAAIGRITPAGTVTEFSTFITGSAVPERIAAGHDGSLWFTESTGNRIGRVTPATGAIKEFPLPFGVTNPGGIAPGPDGNMWFADAQGVGSITPAGVIKAYNAPGNPLGIAPGPDGYMWFTERNGNNVGRLETGVVPPTSGNLLLNPGFEQGTPVPTNTASAPIPGWITVPSFSAATYGATGLPNATTGTQVGGGSGFGWGGTMSANIGTSWALQQVDVAREATGIDAGRATVTLSGLLGGLAGDDDQPGVRAVFLSGVGDEIGSTQIGPVTRAERQDQTTLLRRSATSALPAGTRAVRVVATSTRLNGGPTNDGLFDNLSLTLDVTPAPPAPESPAPGTLPGPGTAPAPGALLADATPPVVNSLRASPAKFAVASGATAITARLRSAPRGTKLSYGLSEPAVVTLSFERATSGRRAGSRCVKATSRNRRAKRCTLYVAAGNLTRSSPLGLSTLQFSGRIGRKALRVGAYRITAVATDAAGNKSSARQANIKVVKP
jgi:streptogramin lyase